MENAKEYLSRYSDKDVRTFKTILISDKDMRRVLGKTAYHLMLFLVREANAGRYVDISVKEMCEKLSLKQHTVSYNINKLVNIEILSTGIKRKNKTTRRQVFAEIAKDHFWRVPESTARVVSGFPLHGGRRTKGTKSGSDCSLLTEKFRCDGSSGRVYPKPQRRSDEAGRETSGVAVSCQVPNAMLSSSDQPTYCINGSYGSYKDSSFLKERRSRPSNFKELCIYNMSVDFSKSVGSPFQESKSTPPPGAWSGQGVPPFPSNELVGMAYRPSPPEVKETMTDKEKVELLVKAYKGAVKSRYGKSDYSMRGNLEEHRNFKALLSAANTLMEKGVAPAVWVMWKFDQSIAFWEKVDSDPEFAQKHKSKKRPKKYSPIYIVYAKSAIAKQSGWCRSESVKYRDSQTYFSPTHKKLTVLWKKMDADLRSQCPLTEEDTLAVVAQTFPSNLYNELVSKAAEENKDKQDRWNYLSSTGVFIW